MSDPPAVRGPSVLSVPEGDNRERMICPDCGFINYENPKIVVGSVCVWEERFLLCRRAINPRRGYWTLPAGYLELQESTPAGAIREAWEEAQARIVIDGLQRARPGQKVTAQDGKIEATAPAPLTETPAAAAQ